MGGGALFQRATWAGNHGGIQTKQLKRLPATLWSKLIFSSSRIAFLNFKLCQIL